MSKSPSNNPAPTQQETEEAAAAQDAAAYAASVPECNAAEARHHARRMGLSPGLLFKLGVWVAAIVAKLRGLIAGQPISETLDFPAFGQTIEASLSVRIKPPTPPTPPAP